MLFKEKVYIFGRHKNEDWIFSKALCLMLFKEKVYIFWRHKNEDWIFLKALGERFCEVYRRWRTLSAGEMHNYVKYRIFINL